jgi:ribose transport system substrate-binding protein
MADYRGTMAGYNYPRGNKFCDLLNTRARKGRLRKTGIENGPQVSSLIDRVAGVKEVLAKYPDIKILSDNQDGRSSFAIP